MPTNFSPVPSVSPHSAIFFFLTAALAFDPDVHALGFVACRHDHLSPAPIVFRARIAVFAAPEQENNFLKGQMENFGYAADLSFRARPVLGPCPPAYSVDGYTDPSREGADREVIPLNQIYNLSGQASDVEFLKWIHESPS